MQVGICEIIIYYLYTAAYKIREELHPDPLPFNPDDDEEVFLLQVPKGFNVQGLVGKKINLQKKTKLQSTENGPSKAMEIIRTRGGEGDLPVQLVTQVAANGQQILKPVTATGMLILREAVKETEMDNDELEEFLNKFDEAENGVIRLPTDLKVRHPLLGADYKEELASRAQAMISAMKRIKQEKVTSPKKAKKRKAPKETKLVEEGQQEGEDEPQPEKKRRKKKTMETTADLQWLENI